MIGSPGNGVLKFIAAPLVALALLLFVLPAGAADEQSDRRVLMGLKLLPALMAADQDLAEKRAKNGELLVVLLYREDPAEAEKAANRLAATRRVGNIALRVATLPYAGLSKLNDDPPAALFLAESSGAADLATVVRFGIQHQRLVFSPFKGDVSAGIQTGIHVAERILPVVNHEALAAANIRLKPFLLEVARTHE